MKTMIRKLVGFFFLLLLLIQSSRFESVNAHSQEPPKRQMTGGMRMVEPNLYAPELYAEKLKMIIALVDLPGAQSPESSIEVSYQVRFIPESESRKFMQQMIHKPKTESSASTPKLETTESVSDILLVEGTFKKTNLNSLANRTFVQDNIVFKSKIPDKIRTKFAWLVTNYSVKIYDGKLKKPLYLSNFYQARPFADDLANPDKANARTSLYTNFFVTNEGDLYTSQWERNIDDSYWGPPRRK